MDDITGITKTGTGPAAGDARLCAGAGRTVSSYGMWQSDFAAANGTQPATRMLVDVPSKHRSRRPRGTP